MRHSWALSTTWLVASCLPSFAGSLPGTTHSIRMHPEQRGAEPGGMLVTARINGGKTLRLLVDTGATRILLAERAAGEARLAAAGVSRIYGVGARGTREGYRARVERIAIDHVELRDVEVDVSSDLFPPGVDGLLGPAIFGDNVVRLDTPGRRLEILPAATQPGEGSPALRRGHYVLLPAEARGLGEGWFLLDTGSEFSVVGHELAPSSGGLPAVLRGVGGTASARPVGPVEFRVAGKRLWDRNAYALDLSDLSRRSGVEIAGLIGFAALRHSVLTIDYRTGRVRIDSK